MSYYIEVKGSKGAWEAIACFINECDCEDCKVFLAEKYKDCKFRVVNDD
jgi:hypothetical protein